MAFGKKTENKSGGKRGKLPTKRSINLALTDEKPVNLKIGIPALILILLAAFAFGKFAVADRLVAVSRAEGQVSALQSELNMAYDKLNSFGELTELYAHYTYSGMTQDEVSRADRGSAIALIRRLGSRGVILLCDSDGGGHLIRSHLRGMLGGIAVYDLYTPAIRGKERRKAQASRAGILGVEGVPNDILEGIFRAFLAEHPEFDADADTSPDRPPREPVTSALLYDLGLNGQPDSAARRSRAAEALGLPPGMSAKAFREAADLIADGETLRQLVREAEDSE